MECGFSVLAGDKEVAKGNDIHTDENIYVPKVVFHHLHRGHKVAYSDKQDEIDQTIANTKAAFKNYRPLFNRDRWLSDREAAEFIS